MPVESEWIERYLEHQVRWPLPSHRLQDSPWAGRLRERVLSALREGLYMINRFPSEHPLWDGSKGEPTLSKLREYLSQILEMDRSNEAANWMLFCLAVRHYDEDLGVSFLEPIVRKNPEELAWLSAAEDILISDCGHTGVDPDPITRAFVLHLNKEAPDLRDRLKRTRWFSSESPEGEAAHIALKMLDSYPGATPLRPQDCSSSGALCERVQAGRSGLLPMGGHFRLWSYEPGGRLQCMALSRDGSRVAFGDRAGWIYVLDAERGHEVTYFYAHDREIESIALDGKGDHLASLGGGEVRVWDIARAQRLAEWERNGAAFCFAPCDQEPSTLVFSNGSDTRLWRPPSVAEPQCSADPVGSLFLMWGREVWAGSPIRRIEAIDPRVADKEYCQYLALLPTGKELLGYYSDASVRIITYPDMRDRRILTDVGYPQGSSCLMAQDGHSMMLFDCLEMRVLNLETAEWTHQIPRSQSGLASVRSLAFSPTGTTIFTLTERAAQAWRVLPARQ